MTEGPKISIIISVLNAGRTLQRCLDSIAKQTYKNWELIIFDGSSTDNTLEILKANEDIITFWKSEPDDGIYYAWNKALKKVTGDWVYFIGADDYLYQKDVLATIAKSLQTHGTNFKVIYGGVNVVASDGEIIRQLGESWEIIKKEFFNSMNIPHQGTFHHQELFIRYGDFDEAFRISGDYEFLIRVLKTQGALFVPNVIVAVMGNEGISYQPLQESNRLKEEIAILSKHGILKNSFYKQFRLFKVLVRKYLMLLFGHHTTMHIVNIYRFLVGKPKLKNIFPKHLR